MGPLPLSIFGSEEAGTAFSLSRASNMAGGFIVLCVNLERGTSSLFFIGDFPGNFIGEINFLDSLALLFIGVAVLGAWMTFKKPEMDKTLKNGLSMSETDPLNHKWLDFAI